MPAAVFVGHMGCYAALPGLGVAADYVSRTGGRRRCSASSCRACTSSRPRPDPQQVVAHALFSDAAAAVVVVPADGTRACACVEVASLTDTTTSDHMTWHITDLGFRMGLSPKVPDVLARHVGPLVTGLLGPAWAARSPT